MKQVQEFLFWIIVALAAAVLILVFTSNIVGNMMQATVRVCESEGNCNSPDPTPTPSPTPTPTPTPTPAQTCDIACKTYGNQFTGTCNAGSGAQCTGDNLGYIESTVSYDSGGNALAGTWGLNYMTGPTMIHIDTGRNGDPAIRLDPHLSGDANNARECDGIWRGVSPGDRVVFSCWEKTQTNQLTTYYPQTGAKIGVDFYSGHYLTGISWAGPYAYPMDYVTDQAVRYNWVHDADPEWQQRTLDFIVPPLVHEDIADPNGELGLYGEPSGIIPWMQAGPPGPDDPTATPVWFSDCELYINPTSCTGTTTSACSSSQTATSPSCSGTCCCSQAPTPPPAPEGNLEPFDAFVTDGTPNMPGYGNWYSDAYAWLNTDPANEHNGNPSVRVLGGTEPISWGEVDGTWLSVQPGDHITMSAWIKTEDVTSTDGQAGAVYGFDFDGHCPDRGADGKGSGGGIIGPAAEMQAGHPSGNEMACCDPNAFGHTIDGERGMQQVPGLIAKVPFGQGWTQIRWDFYVPGDTYYYIWDGATDPFVTGGDTRGRTCGSPMQIDSIVTWFGVRGLGHAWFSEPTLYINP